MPKIKEKVKLCLDEARMLVLGAQILVGFQFRAFLEPGFDGLPGLSRQLRVASTAALLLSLLLIMWAATYHQIVEGGNATPAMQRFGTRVMTWALLPFALGLGTDIYTMSQKVAGYAVGIAMGALAGGGALFCWYIWEYGLCAAGYGRHDEENAVSESSDGRIGGGGTSLNDKIDEVLTECRVVLPGAQAVLGFQLIAVVLTEFDRLPTPSKYVHLASMMLIALSTILLMTPAAYHRIVNRGENTQGFWLHTRRMLLWAMVALAAGLASDFYVVVLKVVRSVPLAAAMSVALLLAYYAAWFGYTFYVRARQDRTIPGRGIARQPAAEPETAGAIT